MMIKKQANEGLYKSQLKIIKKIYDFESNKNTIEKMY